MISQRRRPGASAAAAVFALLWGAPCVVFGFSFFGTEDYREEKPGGALSEGHEGLVASGASAAAAPFEWLTREDGALLREQLWDSPGESLRSLLTNASTKAAEAATAAGSGLREAARTAEVGLQQAAHLSLNFIDEAAHRQAVAAAEAARSATAEAAKTASQAASEARSALTALGEEFKLRAPGAAAAALQAAEAAAAKANSEAERLATAAALAAASAAKWSWSFAERPFEVFVASAAAKPAAEAAEQAALAADAAHKTALEAARKATEATQEARKRLEELREKLAEIAVATGFDLEEEDTKRPLQNGSADGDFFIPSKKSREGGAAKRKSHYDGGRKSRSAEEAAQAAAQGAAESLSLLQKAQSLGAAAGAAWVSLFREGVHSGARAAAEAADRAAGAAASAASAAARRIAEVAHSAEEGSKSVDSASHRFAAGVNSAANKAEKVADVLSANASADLLLPAVGFWLYKRNAASQQPEKANAQVGHKTGSASSVIEAARRLISERISALGTTVEAAPLQADIENTHPRPAGPFALVREALGFGDQTQSSNSKEAEAPTGVASIFGSLPPEQQPTEEDKTSEEEVHKYVQNLALDCDPLPPYRHCMAQCDSAILNPKTTPSKTAADGNAEQPRQPAGLSASEYNKKTACFLNCKSKWIDTPLPGCIDAPGHVVPGEAPAAAFRTTTTTTTTTTTATRTSSTATTTTPARSTTPAEQAPEEGNSGTHKWLGVLKSAFKKSEEETPQEEEPSKASTSPLTLPWFVSNSKSDGDVPAAAEKAPSGSGEGGFSLFRLFSKNEADKDKASESAVPEAAAESSSLGGLWNRVAQKFSKADSEELPSDSQQQGTLPPTGSQSEAFSEQTKFLPLLMAASVLVLAALLFVWVLRHGAGGIRLSAIRRGDTQTQQQPRHATNRAEPSLSQPLMQEA